MNFNLANYFGNSLIENNENYSTNYAEGVKIILYTVLSFVLAFWAAPILIKLLKWLRFWKKTSRTTDAMGNALLVTKEFYLEDEADKKVPRAGGILIWSVVVVIALTFWFVFKLDSDNTLFQFLNFIDRRSTWIPLGALVFSAILGLIDDTLATLESGGNYHAGGLALKQRVMVIAFLGLLIGSWLHFKLTAGDQSNFLHKITIPFIQDGKWLKFDLTTISPAFTIPLFDFIVPAGWALIPITIITILSAWGGSVIDGFDGLAAGCFIPMYIAFAGIALYDNQYKMATFIMVTVGAMLAYLWYNIAPAKFYMGDTGSTSLLVTIAVIAILLNRIWLLPIAGIMIYITAGSNIIQLSSKKFLKRKVFRAAPIHHHFESGGLSRQSITMRYWVVSIVFSMLALALGIIIK